MNLRTSKLVLWIDRNIVKPVSRIYRSIDNKLARYSISVVQMYFFVGLYGALLMIAGHPIAVVGLPWFAPAAYRYLY